MTRRTLLALTAAAALAAPAAAQQLDRRSRDQPEIVVEAGGRVGTCDALTFDRDGRFLFAAGDDKVVRAWPYSAAHALGFTFAGLDTDPLKARTLRWRAWRERFGLAEVCGTLAAATNPLLRPLDRGDYATEVQLLG